ncbi:MBL fold metallo-hydrolase [Natronorarus salvus]|uniref:MBL fold metallo-hydrolase n=1 Tax=Natronorarus salvus TaxID=3117733 RepID=UPI002F26BCEB
MRVTQLGSGGNFPIPMPTCGCRVCTEAREEGGRYVRRGNATFVHDDHALIDTPEQVGPMLNDAGIDRVEYVFLTHFHGDHVNGLSVVQALGRPEFPLDGWANADPPTLVMSEATRRAIERSQPYRLKYDGVFVETRVLDDGESMDLGETTVTNLEVPMAPDGDQRMSNFLFEGDAKLLVSPDETKYLNLYRVPSDLDCWIKECGLFREDPDGDPLFADSLWAEERETEITFERTVEQVEEVRPERTILTELEEIYGRSYDDYLALEERYDRLGITFGYDGLTVDL